MTSTLSCSLGLPKAFRVADILNFHRRDRQQIAEVVAPESLQKGLVWRGLPARLTVYFDNNRAQAELCVDGQAVPNDEQPLIAMVQRMLGLSQDIDAFEEKYRHHYCLRHLLRRQRGLRVPMTNSPFEALTWAITGQQISIHAAVSVRRKLIQTAGVRHSSGLWCYPEAPQIAAIKPQALRTAGFSETKARTLLTLSELVCNGQLPLHQWLQTMPIKTIENKLLAVPGIGPWTVNYSLLRGFGWLDGSLHGDVAVRRGIQKLLGESEKVDMETAKAWLAQFSPWRALVAAHLWIYDPSIVE
ncbi:MAG: hypothetical protein M0Q95_18295, partial [Porticoccaceae bacterium]|nr:hypothetical protein [Porticoccaceae bacterium]